MEELKKTLSRIDGKGYKAYKDLQGKTYTFPGFSLTFHYVQGDPFASPSRLAIRVPQGKASFPTATFEPEIRAIALCDFLTRLVHEEISKQVKGNRGTGKSGMLTIDCPGQEVLKRSSMIINEEYVEARLFAGLPAAGRKVLGRQAQIMFLEELPSIVENTLYYTAVPVKAAIRHIKVVEDQDSLRNQLKDHNLTAFIANDAILPRKSGVDERPLQNGAIPFQSPPTLEVELLAPHAGTVRGLGIPRGITLIVGGGYHGKSTLLQALERGVYNHIPGDGREQVVTEENACKIRAEDGRRVEKVRIHPFINNVPFNQDTEAFSSEDASGSTSQAANIIEALEAGATTLLMDEDTSATNFMIRDTRMQKLVAKDKEPITPFIDKVHHLYKQHDVATILVMGGSGDYFDVSDTVLMMEEYKPREVTEEARQIVVEHPTHRQKEGDSHFGLLTERIPLPKSLNPRKGKKVNIKARGDEGIQFGRETIDLHYVEQIVDFSQTRAIGDLILYALEKNILNGRASLKEIITTLDNLMDEQGLDPISPFPGKPPGNYARPRALEIACAINRLRTLEVKAQT